MRIVLDPGHGGKDSGAVGKAIGVKEKDVTLALAKQLAEKLRQAGNIVFLTRETDVYLTLSERVKKFEEAKADFVLSIHVNSAETLDANYVSAYVYDLNNKELVLRAKRLLDSLQNVLNWPNGGVRQANFYVLRNTKCPAVLLEVGFISNPQQEKLLAKSEIRALLADELAKAISPQPAPKKTENIKATENTANKIPIYFENILLDEGIIIDGAAYAPVRKLVEKLGYKVDWQDGKIIIHGPEK